MRLVGVFPRVNRDGKLVIAASSVRALDYSFLSIFLGVYLTFLEFSAIQAGMVISGIMAGGALSNLVATWRGDAIGRKRMLVGMSALMVLGGILLPLNGSVAFLVVIGLFAMTTATGGDRTAFVSMDTAILTETTDGAQRTLVFSWYNLIAFLGRAIGALLIAGPAVLQSRLDIGEQLSFQIMFGVYAVIAVGGALMSGTTAIDQAMATLLEEGAVSSLSYAVRLTAVILTAATALSTVGLPYFSEMVLRQDWRGLRVTIVNLGTVIFLGSVPIVLGVALLSEPIVAVMFERGSFTGLDTAKVAWVQIMYVLQIPFYALAHIGMRVLLSMDRGNAIAWISAAILLANVVGNYLLMQVMGAAGIALSTSIGYLLGAVLILGCGWRYMK